MVTIDPKYNLLTLINTFEVDPEKTNELLNVLQNATSEVMEKYEGFVSASFHVSKDKKYLTNYAQWRNIDYFNKMLDSPKAQKHMKIAKDISISYHPILYDVVATYE